jgi:hypothetical protein
VADELEYRVWRPVRPRAGDAPIQAGKHAPGLDVSVLPGQGLAHRPAQGLEILCHSVPYFQNCHQGFGLAYRAAVVAQSSQSTQSVESDIARSTHPFTTASLESPNAVPIIIIESGGRSPARTAARNREDE